VEEFRGVLLEWFVTASLLNFKQRAIIEREMRQHLQRIATAN
jgi:hypothetical protein